MEELHRLERRRRREEEDIDPCQRMEEVKLEGLLEWAAVDRMLESRHVDGASIYVDGEQEDSLSWCGSNGALLTTAELHQLAFSSQ